ncbi:MAG: response regulator [Planctomycetes bacterium]|nr:response regulator [Planctomycetota bacterium]
MSPARPTILLVDDDVDVRATLAEALDELGFRPLEAEHGAAALRLLRDGARPDAVLLDLMMPVMDGWALRTHLLADPALASIPVVVFTAHGVTPEAAASLRADALLRKPVGLQELLDALARVLARP